MKQDGPGIMILRESLPNKQSSGSFSRDNKWDMYEFKVRKPRLITMDLETSYDTETNITDVKKIQESWQT